MRRICLLALLLLSVLPTVGQNSDFGVGLTAGADYKLAKGLKMEAEAEVRTQDFVQSLERWSFGVGLNYKLLMGLKVDLGYVLMDRYHLSEVTGKGNVVSGYWAPRHRWYASIIEQREWGRWKVSLRERLQVTHAPLQYVPKHTPEGVRMTDEVKAGDQEHILRSRLQASYNTRHCKFDPSLSVELLTDLRTGGIDQVRYSVGLDYNASKHTVWSAQLRYKDRDDADEGNGWLFTIGYNYTFK